MGSTFGHRQGSVLVPLVLVPAMKYAESLNPGSPAGSDVAADQILDRLLGWRVAFSLPAAVGLLYAVRAITLMASRLIALDWGC